jgi:hypothetical protein
MRLFILHIVISMTLMVGVLGSGFYVDTQPDIVKGTVKKSADISIPVVVAPIQPTISLLQQNETCNNNPFDLNRIDWLIFQPCSDLVVAESVVNPVVVVRPIVNNQFIVVVEIKEYIAQKNITRATKSLEQAVLVNIDARHSLALVQYFEQNNLSLEIDLSNPATGSLSDFHLLTVMRC